MSAEIQFRCPRDRRTMFGRIIRPSAVSRGPRSPQIAPLGDGQDYIEFACSECKRVLGKRGLIVQRVLHRFSLDGAFLRTIHAGQR